MLVFAPWNITYIYTKWRRLRALYMKHLPIAINISLCSQRGGPVRSCSSLKPEQSVPFTLSIHLLTPGSSKCFAALNNVFIRVSTQCSAPSQQHCFPCRLASVLPHWMQSLWDNKSRYLLFHSRIRGAPRRLLLLCPSSYQLGTRWSCDLSIKCSCDFGSANGILASLEC